MRSPPTYPIVLPVIMCTMLAHPFLQPAVHRPAENSCFSIVNIALQPTWPADPRFSVTLFHVPDTY